ncbi:hypothetical protein [Nitrosopumilus sp.]|uniref:hypothetical protein n=1 Tax=Nitrosopumilus sp. TaxID=2024843 RepID=UPI00247E78C4|nr:hypothetical protein [Nitrosopumilus sp.]MCV0409813.1 hypothetical protein [Nitrosopumilus sp.]
MDIASKKLPIILIVILLGILIVQFASNDSDKKFIDVETCEIWVEDSLTKKPRYLDEYDSKCLDFKNLNP